jgi:alpha-mannosidase
LTAPELPDSNGEVLVCPTSHLDWDWLATFAEYVEMAGPPPPSAWVSGASAVLDSVCQVLTAKPAFCFSLAEIGFLRAFLTAMPDRLSVLKSAGPGRFALLGGGITSPDNLVCHGEVFIRTYLLGRQWLKSVGLEGHVAPVAWLPDDFGHDPQLPVVLEAMGLQWLGLSRVPGSPQPFANQPLDGCPSVAAQLDSEGLVFPWIASDGSQVVTHFMPCTYGAIWNGYFTSSLQAFVDRHFAGWPIVNGAPLLMAPAGGDFALAQWNQGSAGAGDWMSIIDDDYNKHRPLDDPVARAATFPDFMARVGSPAGTPRIPLQAQNFWTGHFASRPRLKTLHNRAAQLTLAAEVAATLVRVTSTYSAAMLDDLDAAIERAWQALVPSSHHDYVTGTSPDRVYWIEQLPMLELAVRLGEQCLTRAVGLIAAAGPADPGPDDTAVVVFNPLGFARGGVVQLPALAFPGSVAAVSLGSSQGQVQRLRDGGLLFNVPEQASVNSFGYATAILQAGAEPPPPGPPEPSDIITLENGIVTATIERGQAWAISSFAVEGREVLAPGGLSNSIRIYNDNGNLYQFGNEPLYPPPHGTGTFADSGTPMTGGPGEWLEWGPIRWHFRATVTADYPGQPVSYTLDYLLHAGEAVLRMRLTGTAPSATSVLTAFDLGPPAGAGYGLTYGTANHYDDHEPVRYWDGPTFRATHDFAQTTGTAWPGPAIYHQGVPAWSIYNGQLLGVLLRNTDGTQRGAAGTDTGVHTQEYALGSAGNSQVVTGEALRTALTVTNPLVAAVVDPNQPADSGVSLPPQASLAVMTTESPAGIIRAARTQPGYTKVAVRDYHAERMSFILRIYLPDPASVRGGVVLTFPSLPDPGIPGYSPAPEPTLVTALEEPVITKPVVTVSRATAPGDPPSFPIQLYPDRALTTLRIAVTRWPTQPADGKD